MYQPPADRVHDAAAVITPERVALTFPYAGIGSRFVALAVDVLIQTAALMAIYAAMFSTIVSGFATTRTMWGVSVVLAISVLAVFALYWGYFIVFEALWNGQTPGKRAAKIRVVREDGRPVGWLASAVRNIVRIVDFLPGFYLIGIVSVFLSRESRRLGDFAAGTIVIREEGLETPPILRPEALRTEVAVDPLRAGQLRPQEYELIRAFLLRRDGLAPQPRVSLARQIADPIAARLGVTLTQDHEQFLEGLARAYRQQERRPAGG